MNIHRCRFVPYPAQSINTLAFSRPSDIQRQCPADQRLAIGRENGDIEIWNPAKGLWVQETIFRGGKGRSVEEVVWTHDLDEEEEEPGQAVGGAGRGATGGKLRLFSIGFSSSVTEWDLGRGIPARHANGNFGIIWCLAAQPRWATTCDKSPQRGHNHDPRADQYLAAGCEDGTIVLFSTEDGDLRYVRTMGKPPTKKPKVLSLTWKDRNTLVAGYTDSHIRLYDIRTRQTIRNMSLGKSATGSPETLVWAIKCLPDGTIVSGDSAGDLKIWDGNNYSLVQSIHAHEADILSLATNAKGNIIFTCGSDRRTTSYRRVASGKAEKTRRWAQTMHRRFHESDVKALASFESQELSVVVSGGLDTVPVVMPLREWQKEYHRSLSHLPRCPPVSSAPTPRLLMSSWHNQVSIWHVEHQVQSSTESKLPASPTLLAQLLMQDDENIASAQISPDGKHLAVATISSVKIFRLRLRRQSPDGRLRLRAKKLDSPPSLSRTGARHIAFSPDCRWLCSLRLDNEIVLLRMEDLSDMRPGAQPNKQVVKLNMATTKTSKKHKESGLHQYLESLSNIAFSADSHILAVGDLSGHISIWVLEELEGKEIGPANGVDKTNVSRSSTSSSTASTSEDSSDDEDDSASIHGQRWRRNFSNPQLPSLEMPVLAMSFRPNHQLEKEGMAASDHADGLSPDEDRLVAVTAEHQVVEFHALRGKLSDWSRRNPQSYLPPHFQRIRDRAMGCFWDVSSMHERFWLYGSSWMSMIDMARDLPPPKITDSSISEVPQPPQSAKEKKKRKREEFEAKELRGRGSGAGGPAHLSESYVGIAGHLRKFTDSQQKDTQTVQLTKATRPIGEEDEMLGSYETALTNVRRENATGGQQRPPGDKVSNGQRDGPAGQGSEIGRSLSSEDVKGHAAGFFRSSRYRSILGIVPLDSAVDGKAASENAPEIAIIERPLHEMDGGQNWET